MKYSYIEEAEAIKSFKKMKKRQLLISLPFIILLVGITAIKIFMPELIPFDPFIDGIWGISGRIFSKLLFGFLLSFVIFARSLWKCPACRKYLGKGTPKCCPNCGIRLQEE